LEPVFRKAEDRSVSQRSSSAPKGRSKERAVGCLDYSPLRNIAVRTVERVDHRERGPVLVDTKDRAAAVDRATTGTPPTISSRTVKATIGALDQRRRRIQSVQPLLRKELVQDGKSRTVDRDAKDGPCASSAYRVDGRPIQHSVGADEERTKRLIAVIAIELMEIGELPVGGYPKKRSTSEAAAATYRATVRSATIKSSVASLHQASLHKRADRQAEAGHKALRGCTGCPVDCGRGCRKGKHYVSSVSVGGRAVKVSWWDKHTLRMST
jgi:hypothetical protein